MMRYVIRLLIARFEREDWLYLLALLVLCALVFAPVAGCASYKGGKVVDGTNLAVGMRLPGTEWTLNVLDYIGGMRVAANEGCTISVTNSVAETNSYFGVVTTSRSSTIHATISPAPAGSALEATASSSPAAPEERERIQ